MIRNRRTRRIEELPRYGFLRKCRSGRFDRISKGLCARSSWTPFPKGICHESTQFPCQSFFGSREFILSRVIKTKIRKIEGLEGRVFLSGRFLKEA
jgi:hypothetical protein